MPDDSSSELRRRDDAMIPDRLFEFLAGNNARSVKGVLRWPRNNFDR